MLRVTGKRGKTRLVPLPAGTHEWVRRYIEDAMPKLLKPSADGTLFLSRRGSGLSRSRVFQIMRKCASAAGIQLEVGPHTLRHTAAVWMAEDRIPMTEIAQFLAHSDPSITYRVYARYSPDFLRKAAAALEG